MKHRRRIRLWILFAALALGLVVLPTGSAGAFLPFELIDADTTLTEDHPGGIHIKEDNITLDCAGHSITWVPGDEEFGILIEGFTGVTVKNCVVVGFETGVHITGSSDIEVKNTVSLSEVYGFFIGGFHLDIPEHESHHVTVTNCTASGAMIYEGIGFLVDGGHDITLKNNVSTGNWDNGFRVRGPSHHNLLVNNRAESNGSHGIEVHGYFDDETSTTYELAHNVLRGNISVNNGVIHGGSGFKVGEHSTMNVLEGNQASRNRWGGFHVDEGASSNTLLTNRSFNNDGFGFLVYWHATDNKLVRNLSMRNGVGFLALEYSTGTVLERNILCNNEEANLEYDSTSEPTLIKNKICDIG